MLAMKWGLWLLATLLPCLAHGLTGDHLQVIVIEADQVNIDDRNGVSTYTGSVKLVQGSIQMFADSIVAYNTNHRLDRIIAIGNPARFKQRPDNSAEEVQAEAQRVEFSATSGVLQLTIDAKFFQAGSEFKSNFIEYDTHKDTLRATKSAEGTGRVRVVIQPRMFNKPSN